MPAASCPADPVIEAFASSRLPDAHAAEVREHLQTCASCRQRIARAHDSLESARARTIDGGAAATHMVGSPSPLPPSRPDEISAPLERGETLGRYLIIRALGEGGMGVVYLAYDPELDRRVALKLLRADALARGDVETARIRLLREAQAMARLQHPNVVQVFDVGMVGQKVYLAMELVEGTTVKRWMRSERRPWREVLRIFLDAGRGLCAAHAAGMIHRDFKPDNVLIGKDGRARVTDFGLARALDSSEPEHRTPLDPDDADSHSDGGHLNQPLTVTGTIMGTPAYMAPEQVVASRVDERTDQFSFCVSLYEALYGERPFEGRADPRWPVPPRDAPKGSNVPTWVRRAVVRGLAFKPEQRWPSLQSLLDALANDPAVRTRRLAAVGGATALLTLASGVIVFLLAHRPPDVCDHPDAQLSGIWDDAAQKRAHAAFLATGLPSAETTWGYAERAMAKHTRAWVEQYRDACHDARVAHTESESALDLRLDCLANQRTDISAVVALFAHADKTIVQSASGAAASLPLASDCSDARALALIEPPPPDVTAKVEDLRGRLAAAKALSGAGMYGQAIAALTPLAKESHQLNYRPLEADVLFNLGHAQGRNTEFSSATATFGQALDVALVARTDVLAARAAARRVGAASLAGKSATEVDADVAQARPLVERVGEQSVAAVEFEQALGLQYSNRGREIEGLLHFQRSEDLAEKVYGLDNPQTLIALNNLGAGFNGVGKYDEEIAAYKRALEVSDHIFGPESDNARIVWTNLAQAYADLGRTPPTLEALEHVRALSKEHGDNLYTSTALGAAARTLAVDGRVAEAEKLSDQAMAIAQQRGATEVPDMADVLRYACEVHLAANKPELAVRDYEAVVKVMTGQLEPDSPDWVQYLRVGGAAYLLAGQQPKARAILERGLGLAKNRPFYPGWIPEMRFNLARAVAPTDPRRATELAKQAHDELANVPAQKALLAEVDAWLQKSPR
ncbi:MAG: protein kinase [Deltaproteobacteria bacterium]|nr:protein kinase [Deltaproteobacteria bacterium]